MSELVTAALEYAGCGWPVLPLVPRGKVPLVRHGLKDASTDPEQIHAWWQRWPAANVGIITGPASGLLVVDLDGDAGLGSWARLEAAHDAVVTVEAETGGGGIHLLLEYPATVELGNTSGRLGEGIDTRGKGGYIVAPPSIHPSGRAYLWLPGVAELAPAPRWLVALLEPPKPRTEPVRRATGGADDQRLLARFNGLLDVMAAAQAPVGEGKDRRPGNRNERLFWAATKLRGLKEEGAPPEWEELLVKAGIARGMSEAEARRTVKSGLKAPSR
jgi:hypothetical protein